MTSESNSTLDDRLAQLAARRASAASRTKTTTPAPIGAGPIQHAAPRKKRAHPAANGRVLAASLSTSAFLSIVSVLSAQTAPSGAATVRFTSAAPPRRPVHTTSPTTVVVKTVHHKVYVDANGNPIAALPVPAAHATTYSPHYDSSAARGTAYAPTYHAPTPAYVPPSQPSAHPVTAPAPTPAPVAPPKAPPTTAYHAPAPPPPACTASKCP